MMFANVLIEVFAKGGPIMYPIAIVCVVAFAVVGERSIWWLRERSKRDPKKLEQILAALDNGDFLSATNQAEGSQDPIIRTIYHGLNHTHSSMQGALQVSAGVELQKAGRFLGVMDTLVTLAPLLGLLGTVTVIMGSFKFVGNSDLAVDKVTGGIGEALIATAFGLGIAIFTLIPFNYFTGKVARLQFELETAATNVEVLVNAAKQKGFQTEIIRRDRSRTPAA